MNLSNVDDDYNDVDDDDDDDAGIIYPRTL